MSTNNTGFLKKYKNTITFYLKKKKEYLQQQRSFCYCLHISFLYHNIDVLYYVIPVSVCLYDSTQ